MADVNLVDMVALKLAEADVIADLGAPPVLLLDDVLSELDANHRATLLESVRTFGAQVLLTTADASQVQDWSIADLQMVRIVPGGIEQESS